jgi:uncharacterized membrane protein YhiD involved in acid resistance
MFDISTLTNNQQNPSAILILLSAAMSLALSLVIVFTYEKTSREKVRPDHFIQSLMLMAIVTSTIMQAIGDSLARSFGIFGALAILRFRTNISNPRNVSFIFAAMAVGIGCGVYSFLNAVIGTGAFCLVAFLLRLSPFSSPPSVLGELRFELAKENTDLSPVLKLLKDYTQNTTLKSYRGFSSELKQGYWEYVYQIRLANDDKGMALAQAIEKLPDVRNVRVTINDVYINQTD